MQQFGVEIEISDIQRKLLEILDIFINVCNKYGLQYYAMHGTLLGAVRHKGFIPWDNDIDIAMPRKDYDFLLNNAERVFDSQYFLQHSGSEKSTFCGGYSKLRDKNTTAMRMIDFGHSSCQGVGIDIFPLDNIDVNDGNLKKNMIKLRKAQLQFYAKVYGDDGIKHFGNVSPEEWQQAVREKDNYVFDEIERELLDCCNCYNSDNTSMWTIYVQNEDKVICFEKDDFIETENMLFAGRSVIIPKGYKRILTQIYGKNYMVVPETIKLKSEWSVFYDLCVSYKVYQECFEEVQAIEDKRLVLYGEGELREKCAAKYVNAKALLYAEDVNEIINIKMDVDEVIICSDKFIARAKELRRAGIETYRIYVPYKKWLFERKRRNMRLPNEEIL